MATRKRAAKKEPKKVDFDDADAVLRAVAAYMADDPREMSIEEDSGLTGFGEGTIYRITSGKTEWCVAESESVAYDLAKAVVTQDLEQEPEIFEQSFLESHIDMDRLRRELESDVLSYNEETLRERSTEDFWREAEGEGMTAPDEDEDGELREPTESEISDLAERQTSSQLQDPMEYLSDIYGDKEAVEQAIKIAGIDIDSAADDAVDTDGWEHFLARYDGKSDSLAGGIVYWRDN